MRVPGTAADGAVALSVVIPTRASYDTLSRVLDGLSRQRLGHARYEVILAVDASEEDPAAVEAAIGKREYAVRRVMPDRPGASANRNAGVRAAAAPLILFIDNDTVPRPDLLAQHLLWHERHPDEATGVLGLVQWAREVKVTPFMRWLDTGIQFDYANMVEGDVGWGRFYSANVSLKRRFIESVGPFDEERFPYGYEDTDWAYRASKLGFRLLYNPRAVVDHLRTMTLDFWKTRIRRVAASEYQFCRVHPEMDPWFQPRFVVATKSPPARGRGVRLAPYVPPRFPWLGARVWRSVHSKYMQELAPHFLEAWDEAIASGGPAPKPDLAEWA